MIAGDISSTFTLSGYSCIAIVSIHGIYTVSNEEDKSEADHSILYC